MSIQKFNIQVWEHIKASILDLNREELEYIKNVLK